MNDQLQKFLKDSSGLMTGETLFDEDIVNIKKDDVYVELFRPIDDDFDSLTQQALEFL